MPSETRQIQVSKITEEEMDTLTEFLKTVGEKVKELDHYFEDCNESNEEIGKMVRQSFPHREAFVGPLNLKILIDNYQDKESDVLAHPKWLMEMYELFEEIDQHLSNTENKIESGSILHQKIKKQISE